MNAVVAPPGAGGGYRSRIARGGHRRILLLKRPQEPSPGAAWFSYLFR